MEKVPVAFEDVIAPLSRERFLSEFWNKSFVHLSGRKGRFTPLLPWDELNSILEWHCPPQPQLRLFQDGQMVDVRRYIDGPVGALRLNAGGLIASLSQGASMVLDSVQDVAPRVSQLTSSLQNTLGGFTVANLYAGWRTQKAFDLHWDPQDVIVLQLYGRKRWKVHAPTRLHPLQDDIEKAQKPMGEPLWEGLIEDGDMLYLPRGWWHMAYPLDEPSLHLSFGVEPPNGADFLRWWTARMLRYPEIRKNLPLESDATARRDYLAKLLELMSADGGQLEEFLGERKAERRTRPRVHLPAAPIEQQRPLTRETHIRLAALQSLFIEFGKNDRMARFFAAGTYWNFRPELIPVFQRLSGQAAISLQELCADIHDQELLGMLMSALDMLANAGVIFKELPEAP